MNRILVALIASLFALSAYAGNDAKDKPVNCKKIAQQAEQTAAKAAREQAKADMSACAAAAGQGRPTPERKACESAAKDKENAALKAAKEAAKKAEAECKAAQKK